MYRPAMQGRAGGHLPFRASILPVDMPVKDPILSSSLGCEAVRTLFESMLSKTGPDGVDVIGSQGQGPVSIRAATR